jgi:hypothetical protein
MKMKKELKALHWIDGKMIGYLWKEYKDTVSVINFDGIKCTPRITRRCLKSNIKEFQGVS